MGLGGTRPRRVRPRCCVVNRVTRFAERDSLWCGSQWRVVFGVSPYKGFPAGRRKLHAGRVRSPEASVLPTERRL